MWCQLILVRTRVIPKGFTQPKAELYAGLVNTNRGEIVKRSLKKWHQSSVKLTNNQIVLHWIDNDEKPRVRVVEIKRVTSNNRWYYINTDEMIADLGIRKGAALDDVYQNSAWINWMQLDHSQFPINDVKNPFLCDEILSQHSNTESWSQPLTYSFQQWDHIAENHYFRKASEEIRQFLAPKKFE